MFDVIQRSVHEPIRLNMTWEQYWLGSDRGLIKAWEIGRQLRDHQSEIVVCAERRELPVLPWKGGVEKTTKAAKWGSLYYLAQWQGMRGDDLKINTKNETRIVCAKTGVTVTFVDNVSIHGNDT